MSQADMILAKFPGPVVLHFTLARRLFGLVFTVCVTALLVYIWIVNPSPRYRAYDMIMQPFALFVFGALTIRAAILVLFPSTAQLTLDADGFEIGQVFRRRRVSWRHVSEFRVETIYWRYGPQVAYNTLGARRRGVVPEFYGRPRLKGEELVRLMNAWRARALALPPETSVPIVRRAD